MTAAIVQNLKPKESAPPTKRNDEGLETAMRLLFVESGRHLLRQGIPLNKLIKEVMS
jgi:hypothetical protein